MIEQAGTKARRDLGAHAQEGGWPNTASGPGQLEKEEKMRATVAGAGAVSDMADEGGWGGRRQRGRRVL